MHRSNLLAQLDEYSARFPNEQACVARFIELIETQSRCFERDCWEPGHITGSAWVVDTQQSRVLLTHHRKLNIWVQLGGHSDGDTNTPEVALREAQEESGLPVLPLNTAIFDLDIHEIPARKAILATRTLMCVMSLSQNTMISCSVKNLTNWPGYQSTPLRRKREKPRSCGCGISGCKSNL